MERYIEKKEKASYGFAASASYMLAAVTQSYLMYFFTDIALLSAGFVMGLMIIARVWDAINDPIMGLIIEKTHTRYGKMRPHVFIGSFCILITSILLFVPIGEANPIFKMIYASVVYILYGMSYTLVDVPAMGLMSVSTPNNDERASLLSFYVTVGTVGGLLPIGILPIMQSFIPEKWLYLTLAILSGVMAFAGYMLLFKNAKERFATRTEKYKVKEIVKTASKNKPMLLTFLMSMIASPRYLIMPVIIYVATYVVHIGNLGSGTILLLLYVIIGAGMFAGIFLTPWVYKKVGYKSTSLIFALIGGIGLTLAFLIYKINVYASFPFLTIGGLGLGAYNVLPYPMVGDSLDYLEWKTGERMEGMCFSLNSFVTKFNNAVGFIGLALGLIILKFVEPVVVGVPLPQTQYTIDGFYALMTIVPGISFFLSMIPMFFYDYDKEKKKNILSELDIRRKEGENGRM